MTALAIMALCDKAMLVCRYKFVIDEDVPNLLHEFAPTVGQYNCSLTAHSEHVID